MCTHTYRSKSLALLGTSLLTMLAAWTYTIHLENQCSKTKGQPTDRFQRLAQRMRALALLNHPQCETEVRLLSIVAQIYSDCALSMDLHILNQRKGGPALKNEFNERVNSNAWHNVCVLGHRSITRAAGSVVKHLSIVAQVY